MIRKVVFIHRSIKTRIETCRPQSHFRFRGQFLYIDPLKQGLKLDYTFPIRRNLTEFLYIDPLKQGLKLELWIPHKLAELVFIHRSIKTRIETFCHTRDYYHHCQFLYIDPLKQGLKLV